MLVFIATESANRILHNYNYTNDSDMEMAELSFEGLDGASCNLTVTTTGPEYIEQCLEDIEITNMSKQTYNTTVLCIQ